MKKNLGNADRGIRIVIAIVLVTLYFLHRISGPWAIAALVVSGVFVLTSFISFCPIYWIFGMHSNKKESQE